MKSRREFIKHSLAGTSAICLSKNALADTPKAQEPPRRFIFIRKASGLIPTSLIPPTLSEADLAKEEAKQELDLDLTKHDLPEFMKPIESFQSETAIIQGLSGKMMKSESHHPCHAVMGLVASRGGLNVLERTSIDFELAKLFPSAFNHIGFAASEHDKNPISAGYSIKAPGVPNFVYRTPKAAYSEIFGAVAATEEGRIKFSLQDQLFRFAYERQNKKLKQGLTEIEERKVSTYLASANEIVERNAKLKSMAGSLKDAAPDLDPALLADDPLVTERQQGHFEIATSALIAGLTNVVTINLDSNKSYYTMGPLNQAHVHGVGHNINYGGLGKFVARNYIKTHHMKLIAQMITKLKSVKEGDGTMFDNTTLVYFPDNGEKHHAVGDEWPWIVISGKNSKLDLAGRYLRFAPHGEKGHKTLGNWYTTLLNVYGNPMEHYGPLDPKMAKLKLDQTGAIKEIIA